MMRTLIIAASLVVLRAAAAAPLAAAAPAAPSPAGDRPPVGASSPVGAAAAELDRDDDDAALWLDGAPVNAPPIGAVLAAAYASAGLAHDPGDSWIRRARLAGLVPWVTVRTTRDTSWQDDQPEVGHSTSLELRATWRLDRLVFDGRELQVAAIEASRRREHRRLAARVIRTYFTWRRAAGVASGASQERAVTRADEARAELDALTDGWFSRQLAGSRRASNAPAAASGAAQ